MGRSIPCAARRHQSAVVPAKVGNHFQGSSSQRKLGSKTVCEQLDPSLRWDDVKWRGLRKEKGQDKRKAKKIDSHERMKAASEGMARIREGENRKDRLSAAFI